MSRHFGETLRTAPADVDVASHQLLLRAGYVRQIGAGIFSYLPLGLRAMRKIEKILGEEMEAIGGQELIMPIVHPAELWKRTGRWYRVGDEMVRFTDRAGRPMVVAMTHEEIVAELARTEIRSYRQLPMLVYQIQEKFRDEPRPRAGLIRVREFTMKDSYSLDRDPAGLDEQYRNHYRAYHRIFQRVGLASVIAVRSDPGMMGGKVAHEFIFLSEIGEDTLALCDSCSYAANLQVARFSKPEPREEPPRALEKVATPGASTIEALAVFLDVPSDRTAKVVFFSAAVPSEAAEPGASREVLVMALVRGDMEASETKLRNAIGAQWTRPAEPAEIRGVGAVPGFASPVGLESDKLVVVVDDLVAATSNMISGANEEGFHYRNVNCGRDYEADVVTDIAAAYEAAPCPDCRAPLSLARGVEVGNIFQLGTDYAEALGATYQDEDGRVRPIVMGSYGIGVGRLLACIAEAHRDERGLRLPVTVAPYQVYLIGLGGGDATVRERADALDSSLREAGIEVLYDDRDVGGGVKFKDADLIGLPVRATVSARSLTEGGVELKRRDRDESHIVAIDHAAEATLEILSELQTELDRKVRTVPYPDRE